MGAVTLMTYLLSIGQRYPQKFHISLRTGNIWASELLPSMLKKCFETNFTNNQNMIDISNAEKQNFLIVNNEYVPFRMTPNIQNFITPIGMEGVFTSSVMAIARSLTEPEVSRDIYIFSFPTEINFRKYGIVRVRRLS
jgi:transformation/transcription domain-associated protein